jgi:hypothetical protein
MTRVMRSAVLGFGESNDIDLGHSQIASRMFEGKDFAGWMGDGWLSSRRRVSRSVPPSLVSLAG